MQFPHPIRSIQQTIFIWAKFLASLRDTIENNSAVVAANTASNEAILSVLRSLLLEASHTEKAVSYLAAIERHRQISAGQPHVFPEVIQ